MYYVRRVCIAACRSWRKEPIFEECAFAERIAVDAVNPNLCSMYKIYRNVFSTENILLDTVDPVCRIYKVYRKVFSGENISVGAVYRNGSTETNSLKSGCFHDT
jgi:hypothetical protein